MKNRILIVLLPALFVLSLLAFPGCEKESFEARNTGTGGSMARFVVKGDHLYLVNHRKLIVFSLDNPAAPVKVDEIELGNGIETLFPYGNYLLIGTTSGMLVYSLSDPAHPAYVSTFAHAEHCDPVVAEKDYAYLTLRSGTPCEGTQNELQILNIQNINNPFLESTWQMKYPHGLGIDDTLLFVCEGAFGLKVFDVNSPVDISLLYHFTDVNAYDVIPYNGLLMVTGDNGLFQFDYSDPANIKRYGQFSW